MLYQEWVVVVGSVVAPIAVTLIVLVRRDSARKAISKKQSYAERKRHQVQKHQEVVGNQIRNVLKPLMAKMRARGHTLATFEMFDDVETGLTRIRCTDTFALIVEIKLNFWEEKVMWVWVKSRPGYTPYEIREENIKEMLRNVGREVEEYFDK